MSSPSATLIHFQCGPHHLALPMSRVIRIDRDLTVDLHHKSDQPFGWTTFETHKIPVLDLGYCLGETPRSLDDPGQFLIIEHNGKQLGILAEKVIRARPAHTFHLRPLFPGLRQATRNLFEAVAAGEPPVFVLDTQGLAFLANLTPLPQPVPNQRPRSLDMDPIASAQAASAMLSFSLGKEKTRWGLSLAQVSEIRQPEPLVPVAGSPNFLKGLLWWRKEPVPVVDLNLRQGWPASDRPERVLVTKLGTGTGHLGFFCGSDLKIERDLTVYEPIPLSASRHGNLARGAFKGDQGTLVIPDLETVFV